MQPGDVVHLSHPPETVPAGLHVVLAIEADVLVIAPVESDGQDNFFANRRAGVFRVAVDTVRPTKMKAKV